jgi:hypothetical protein
MVESAGGQPGPSGQSAQIHHSVAADKFVTGGVDELLTSD